MMKKASLVLSMVGISALALFSAPAEAKNPQDWTCSEFIQVPNKAKPNVVYWLDGFNKGSKSDTSEVTAKDFNHPIGKLVDECRKNKTENLWDAIVKHFYSAAKQIP
ncbi:HdeA/HdeB family chaperone [Methylocapsa polymorpha]|uniref:HdeA/HdeB family chaperone n=1 Tax=Methylocapsa polymorpha TaxID=3080828 RepID=A0ABZ0HTF4_9HYPH|nr:HdeA/HdeB family chaperone [Methylocapsa sp. RX1]